MEKRKRKTQNKLVMGCLLIALLCTALFAGVPAPALAEAATPKTSTSFDWNKNYSYNEILSYPGAPQTKKIKPTRDTIALGSWCEEFPCNHMVPRVYTSQEEAAKDFGMTYGKWSIRKSREVGTMIFKLGEKQFVMALPRVGNKSETQMGYGCFWKVLMDGSFSVLGDAIIHSHGSEGWLDYKEKLSGPDMATAAEQSIKVPVPIYVTTPWGDLKRAYANPDKYDYYYGFWFMYVGWIGYKNETVASNMPHDRTSDGQALKFKHWFGKKCDDCAQKG